MSWLFVSNQRPFCLANETQQHGACDGWILKSARFNISDWVSETYYHLCICHWSRTHTITIVLFLVSTHVCNDAAQQHATHFGSCRPIHTYSTPQLVLLSQFTTSDISIFFHTPSSDQGPFLNVPSFLSPAAVEHFASNWDRFQNPILLLRLRLSSRFRQHGSFIFMWLGVLHFSCMPVYTRSSFTTHTLPPSLGYVSSGFLVGCYPQKIQWNPDGGTGPQWYDYTLF